MLRNTALAKARKTWTLRYIPALFGFVRLNMTPKQLEAIELRDPFTRYYFTAYSQTIQASKTSLNLYKNITAGKEITDISDYLKLAEFFESAMEPAIGVNRFFKFITRLHDHFCRGHALY